MTQSSVDQVLQTIGEAMAYRAYMPAHSLGSTIGLDVGVDASMIQTPTEFNTIIQTVTGQAVPGSIIVPHLNIHKGLPMNIDLGFTYLPNFSNVPTQKLESIGFEGKWTPINMGSAGLNLGGRLTYDSATLAFVSMSTIGVEAVGSFGLGIIEPYAALGFDETSATIDVSGATVPLPGGVKASGSYFVPKGHVGLALKLMFIKVAGQFDFHGSGGSSFGLKASLGF
jgi:hypothetical protein